MKKKPPVVSLVQTVAAALRELGYVQCFVVDDTVIGSARVVVQIPAKDQDPHDIRVRFRPARIGRAFILFTDKSDAVGRAGEAVTVVKSVEEALAFIRQIRSFEDLE